MRDDREGSAGESFEPNRWPIAIASFERVGRDENAGIDDFTCSHVSDAIDAGTVRGDQIKAHDCTSCGSAVRIQTKVATAPKR